ncbi:MAG: thermonuclease family protein [Nanoarchaeota archaeon]|nr:thermonuclease family protein [Nanoarchaeota archaeon]
MKKRALVLLIILSVVLVSFLLFIFVKYALENPNEQEEEANVSSNYVLEVIDGDTFKLGNEEIVRLICVDAPEKGKQGYEEAKEFLSSLILNKEIRLEKDVSDKDEYGRALRYVYVNISGVEFFVNQQLAQEGYASVFRYGNDTSKCGEIESGE